MSYVHCQVNYTFGCSTLRKLLILLRSPSKAVRASSLRTLHFSLDSSISCFRLCRFVCIHLSKGQEGSSWFSITGEFWHDLAIAPRCGEKGAEVGGVRAWQRRGGRCGEEGSGVEGVRGGLIGVSRSPNRVKSKTGVRVGTILSGYSPSTLWYSSDNFCVVKYHHFFLSCFSSTTITLGAIVHKVVCINNVSLTQAGSLG